MLCHHFTKNLEVEQNEDPGTFGGSTTIRKCTDKLALTLTITFYAIITALIIYCFNKRDMSKLFNGYDDCGNICGKKNHKTTSIPYQCFGVDMTKKKYVFIRESKKCGYVIKDCVYNCTMDAIIVMSSYCVFDRNLIPFYNELYDYYRYFILFGITLLNGIVMYHSFCHRYKTLKPIKPVIISVTVLIMAAFFAFGYYQYRTTKSYVYLIQILIYSVIAFVIFILVLPSLCYFHSHVDSYVTLHIHNEAIDAISNIPAFWLIPVLSCLAIIFLTFFLIYCIITLQSFSYLREIFTEMIVYVQHPISICTETFIICAFLLLCEIIKNLQCFVIGGCVARWYFSKSGDELPHLVKETIYNIFRYHLGTLFAYSIMLTLTYPLRIFINAINAVASLTYKECSPNIMCWGLTTRHGLTMTAIYGCSFCAATSRAHKLFHGNLFNAAAIRKLGEFYFVCWKTLGWFFMVGACLVILTHRYGNTKEILAITVCFAFWSAIIVECFTTGIEVAIDAIFLCFCEDCLFNNGTSKPYFMSANFAHFIAEANQHVDPVRWHSVAEDWVTGPGQLY